MPGKAKTLGELRASGYKPLNIREEIRNNLIGKIENGEGLFPGIIGFDDSVIPMLENAILAGQDIILLGERGTGEIAADSAHGITAGRGGSGDGGL